MLQANSRVRIIGPGEPYDGEIGTIIKAGRGGPFPYQVRMSDGDFWFTAEEVELVQDDSRGYDFDRTGLGIGGINRADPYYDELDVIHALERDPGLLDRIQTRERTMRVCRRCGDNDLYDGAMFTTDPASGLCDDCYG